VGLTVAAEHAPTHETVTWSLELQDGESNRCSVWRLSLPMHTSPDVETCEAAVRLHFEPCNSTGSVGELCEIAVPAQATPIDTSAVRCIYNKKKHKLVVEWPAASQPSSAQLPAVRGTVSVPLNGPSVDVCKVESRSRVVLSTADATQAVKANEETLKAEAAAQAHEARKAQVIAEVAKRRTEVAANLREATAKVEVAAKAAEVVAQATKAQEATKPVEVAVTKTEETTRIDVVASEGIEAAEKHNRLQEAAKLGAQAQDLTKTYVIEASVEAANATHERHLEAAKLAAQAQELKKTQVIEEVAKRKRQLAAKVEAAENCKQRVAEEAAKGREIARAAKERDDAAVAAAKEEARKTREAAEASQEFARAAEAAKTEEIARAAKKRNDADIAAAKEEARKTREAKVASEELARAAQAAKTAEIARAAAAADQAARVAAKEAEAVRVAAKVKQIEVVRKAHEAAKAAEEVAKASRAADDEAAEEATDGGWPIPVGWAVTTADEAAGTCAGATADVAKAESSDASTTNLESERSSEEWRQCGAESAAAGKLEEAASCYSASRKARAEEWHTRGNEAAKEGDFEAAVTSYSAALASGRGDEPVLLANRAHCLSKMERHTEAVEDALRCAELRPDFLKAYFRGAMALHALGRDKEALALLKRAPSGDQVIDKWIISLSAELAQLAEEESVPGSATLNAAAPPFSSTGLSESTPTAATSTDEELPASGVVDDLPTKNVSGFLISNESAVINVHLPLEKLFVGARMVFRDEHCFHMDVRHNHLTVRFVGPTSKTSSDQVFWIMSVALPHEVEPAKASLKLWNGKLSIKLPKARGAAAPLKATNGKSADETHADAAANRAGKSQAELQSNQAPPEAETLVETLRELAKEHFKAKAYAEAKRCYTEALGVEPKNPTLMSNRAAASLMLGEWQEACEDAGAAATLSSSSGKTNERYVRCLLLSDRLAEAMDFCREALSGIGQEQVEKDPEWKLFLGTAHRVSQHAADIRNVAALLMDKKEAAQGQTAAQAMLKQLDEMLGFLGETEMASPWGFRLRFCKVQACIHPVAGTSGQSAAQREKWAASALEIVAALVTERPEDPLVLHWQGRVLLRKGRRVDARASLKEAMRVTDGDHAPSEDLSDGLRSSEKSKEQGNDAFKVRDWTSAQRHYDTAIQADRHRLDSEFSASLYCNRSAARSKLGQALRALEDITAALAINPNYTKALFRRAMLYMELERYQSAAQDFDKVKELAPNFVGLGVNRTRAKRWAAEPPARNHYAVLGIGFDASATDIKKAYRAAALKWHPDKNRDRTAQAEKMFKDVQEANEVLSDPEKKAEFDNPEPAFSHQNFGHFFRF